MAALVDTNILVYRFDPRFPTAESETHDLSVLLPRTSPSSRGLGSSPFKAETRVRIPLGTPIASCCRPKSSMEFGTQEERLRGEEQAVAAHVPCLRGKVACRPWLPYGRRKVAGLRTVHDDAPRRSVAGRCPARRQVPRAPGGVSARVAALTDGAVTRDGK